MGRTPPESVVGRHGDASVPLDSGDVTVTDGPTTASRVVVMRDVAVHHVAGVLATLRSAAAKVRAIRRGAVAVAVMAAAAVALAPNLALDGIVTAASLIALAVATSLPLARWR